MHDLDLEFISNAAPSRSMTQLFIAVTRYRFSAGTDELAGWDYRKSAGVNFISLGEMNTCRATQKLFGQCGRSVSGFSIRRFGMVTADGEIVLVLRAAKIH